MRSAMRAIISAAAMLLLACGVVEDERSEPVLDLDPATGDKTPVQLFDAGKTCLYADSVPETFEETLEPQRFEENARLAVEVSTTECLSMTCDVDRVAFCEVDQDANTIYVSSYLAYNEVDAPMCTLDCGSLVATCQSEPLPAGDYSIVHGDMHAELTVPSTLAPCGGTDMMAAPAE